MIRMHFFFCYLFFALFFSPSAVCLFASGWRSLSITNMHITFHPFRIHAIVPFRENWETNDKRNILSEWTRNCVCARICLSCIRCKWCVCWAPQQQQKRQQPGRCLCVCCCFDRCTQIQTHTQLHSLQWKGGFFEHWDSRDEHRCNDGKPFAFASENLNRLGESSYRAHDKIRQMWTTTNPSSNNNGWWKSLNTNVYMQNSQCICSAAESPTAQKWIKPIRH